MFKNYLKTSLRTLWKNKTYSFLNIFGLAIGIACAGLIFLWVGDEMTFDQVHAKKDRLYSVYINNTYAGNIYTGGSTPRPMASALKTEIPGIINAARVSDEDQQSLFSYENKALYASGRYADPALFTMFSITFVQGNARQAFQQLYSIVMTERTAKKFFGADKNVIGRKLRIDNTQDLIVTGVVKDLPENSTLHFEWLAPYEITILQMKAKWGISDEFMWGSYGPFTYVELDANANLTDINNRLKNFIQQKEPSQKNSTFLFPMSDWHLYNEFINGIQTGGGAIKQVKMLSAIAWIILIIACINFMNLSTANSQKRAKEIGVRKVMGAGRKKLIVQFLVEALTLSICATIAAVVIMTLTLPAFNILMHKNLGLHVFNPLHIISLLIISIVCGLIAGCYPSLYLSSFNPALVLKGMKVKTGSASLIRKGLVILQFSVSVVFIISTTIVYMQIQHVKNRKLGFKKDNLIEVDMQHDITKNFPAIKEDLLHTGFIENAALTDHVTIYGGNSDGRFNWPGKPKDHDISITFRDVSPEFVSTSGMEIIAGRDFSLNAAAEGSNIIITQSLEKIMGKGSAVGKIIQSPRGNKDDIYTNLTVVGIVDDYIYGSMYEKPGPVIFFCRPPEDANLVYIRIKPQSDPDQILAKIEAVMKKDNPAYPLKFKFVDDQFNEMFFNETQISKVSGVFASLAIIISCLGLFGLATFTAERRTKEIGIRKVLGASVAGLTSLLSKDFLRLVLISCLVAFPAAWWIMHDWLQNYEYRIVISWWIFLLAGLTAIIIALCTISFQTIKAAVANPVNSLRAE